MGQQGLKPCCPFLFFESFYNNIIRYNKGFMPENKKLICVGIITSAHGIKGAVKIKSFTEDPVDIAGYPALYGADGITKFNIKILSENGDVLIVEVAGVKSRNDAEKLGGTELYVYRDMLPETNEDEFYYEDLIGMGVRLADNGKSIGKVSAVYNHGAGDIIELKLNSGKVELLAFTEQNVPEVNISEAYIAIIFPEAEFVPDNDNNTNSAS